MSYRPDTIEGVLEFCAAEGQPADSVRRLRGSVVDALEHLAWGRPDTAADALRDALNAESFRS